MISPALARHLIDEASGIDGERLPATFGVPGDVEPDPGSFFELPLKDRLGQLVDCFDHRPTWPDQCLGLLARDIGYEHVLLDRHGYDALEAECLQQPTEKRLDDRRLFGRVHVHRGALLAAGARLGLAAIAATRPILNVLTLVTTAASRAVGTAALCTASPG
jgi:hypothetical protein